MRRSTVSFLIAGWQWVMGALIAGERIFKVLEVDGRSVFLVRLDVEGPVVFAVAALMFAAASSFAIALQQRGRAD